MNNAKIAVVDDDVYMRNLLHRAISKEGFDVLCFGNADEALDSIQKYEVDVVLSDVIMEKHDGYWLLHEVHKLYPDLPVILMTGYCDNQTRGKGLKEGAYEILFKPLKFKELTHLLKKASEEVKNKITVENVIAKNESNHTEALNKFKDELMTLVLHEFRTPLTSIMSGVDLFHESHLDEIKRKNILSIIQSGGHRCKKILDDIMEFLSLKNGLDSFELEEWSFLEIIREAIASKKEIVEKKNLKLSLLAPEYPVYVRTDRNRVKEVISRILDNAIKYSKQDGLIHCFVECKKTNENQPAVICSIADYGVGFSSDKSNKVFDGLSIGHEIDNHRSGIGLSLAISKLILKELGGSITIDSTEGEGTRVFVSLPLVQSVPHIAQVDNDDLIYAVLKSVQK